MMATAPTHSSHSPSYIHPSFKQGPYIHNHYRPRKASHSKMKLKDISRTAAFAWDQTSSSSPLIVTGAVAGALDESFSNESQLEIWAPDFGGEAGGLRLGGEGQKGPEGSISVSSR